MANLLKKKFIGNDQVDGSKILLENDQYFRIKLADGSSKNLFKLDATNKLQLSDAPIITTPSTDANAVQTKSQMDSAVSAEATLRSNADAALQTEVDAAEASIAQEITDRQAADTTLQNNINLKLNASEKGAASGVCPLDASSLIPSQYLPAFVDDILEYDPKKASTVIQDLTHTADVGGVAGNSISLTYVKPAAASSPLSVAVSGNDITVNLATDAGALAISTAADIKAALEANASAAALIDIAISGVGTNVQAAQAQTFLAGGTDGKGAFPATGEVGKLYLAKDTGKLYRWSGSVYVEVSSNDVNSVNGEVGVVVLDAGDIKMLDGATSVESKLNSLQTEVDAEEVARANADTALDGRLDVLEAIGHYKHKHTMIAADVTNGYVDLPHSAKANSLVAHVDRLGIHEGAAEDYTISVVGGVTRVTFVNSLVSPGAEALAAGDNLYFKYQA